MQVLISLKQPFSLGVLSLPQDASAIAFPHGCFTSLPLVWCFVPKIPCMRISFLWVCICLFFFLLLFLRVLLGRKQRRHLAGLGRKLIPMGDATLCDGILSTRESVDEVFILAGQSNMSGRGGVQTKHHTDGSTYKKWDHVVPSECEAEKGAIWRLSANLDWVEAHEPLHHDIDRGKTCGVGPGLVFAASVLRQYPIGEEASRLAIGLVPCAIGGSEIREWEKGSKHYEDMIRRAKFATSKGGSLKALLWYQGESDTYSSENVKQFPARLDALFTHIRIDLQNSELPIIQVGITAKNHPFPQYLEEVRAAQKAVNLPGVYYVDAKGLSLLEDNIHLNMHSQVQVGKMLANMYLDGIIKPVSTSHY